MCRCNHIGKFSHVQCIISAEHASQIVGDNFLSQIACAHPLWVTMLFFDLIVFEVVRQRASWHRTQPFVFVVINFFSELGSFTNS